MPKKKRQTKKKVHYHPIHTHEEAHKTTGIFLRDFVFGIQDGLVSTLGIVAGVFGATITNNFVVIAGLAGMLAGAISMASGTYLSAKAEKDFYNAELAKEKREIKEVPEIEEEEIRQLYKKKGFRGKDLEHVVKVITSDEETWLNVMMDEELGLSKPSGAPAKAATVMGISFFLVGFIPIIPFLLLPALQAIWYSVAATVIALFAFGAYNSTFTQRKWFRSGFEMLLVGSFSAIAGYAIGTLFLAI